MERGLPLWQTGVNRKVFPRKERWIELNNNNEDDDDSIAYFVNNNSNNNNNNILLLPLLAVFTIVYLKQTMFLGYKMMQLFCIYSLCYT